MVPLAESITHIFGSRKITRIWQDNSAKLFEKDNRRVAEIHAIITSLKVICTESTGKNFSETRQACGGLGMSQFAGIGLRMNDQEGEYTWEGDNNVLIQQAAKYLLDLFAAKFKGKTLYQRLARIG